MVGNATADQHCIRDYLTLLSYLDEDDPVESSIVAILPDGILTKSHYADLLQVTLTICVCSITRCAFAVLPLPWLKDTRRVMLRCLLFNVNQSCPPSLGQAAVCCLQTVYCRCVKLRVSEKQLARQSLPSVGLWNPNESFDIATRGAAATTATIAATSRALPSKREAMTWSPSDVCRCVELPVHGCQR